MKAMQQEREIRSRLGRQTMRPKTHIIRNLAGIPFVTERRIRNDGVKMRYARRILLLQEIPLVGERIAMKNLEFRVLHAMQKHVHARQVISGDVLFLTI